MPDLIKFGFSGGVFSPKLAMRSDLKKYDLGLAEGRNWFIEYTGGASTRPGTEFVDYIQDDEEPARIVEFAFNRNIANTYGILFAKDRIRFLQDGAYVLEAAQTIVSVSAATITLPAHGYLDGDWVKILGRTYEITSATTDTFALLLPDGTAVADATTLEALDVARIYTIASPYAPADLNELTFSQYRDELYIHSTEYETRKLVRSAATSWELSVVDFAGNNNVPTGITLTPSAPSNFGAVFAVTMVDTAGRESYIGPTAILLHRTMVNYTTTAGYMTISWAAPASGNVAYYKVYRSLITTGSQVHYGMDLGFIGRSFYTKFTDNNIIPDYTQTPPRIELPVVGGQAFTATVTAGGSGYTDASRISLDVGGGSDFSAVPIVENGVVKAVRVLNPGFGYSAGPLPLTFGSPGTGAAATVSPAAITGNYPATSAMVQQRRVRAGTNNYPGTLFGSRVGDPDNYYSSGAELATDPYALSIDSEQLTPIRFIMPYPEGAFVFQDTGVLQVRGLDDGVIKSGSAKNQELTEDGCARLQPIQIKRDYIYLNSAKTSVYALGPSNLPQYYVPNDISIFSEHYFSQSNPIVSWTWAKSPHKLLWAAREDGSFLSLTYVSEQEVTAWSDHTTRGFVECIETVLENEIDRPYLVVRRVVGGVERRYIERMALREYETPDEAWAVDCGLRTSLTYPAASIYLDDTDPDAIIVTASSAIFTPADVGKVFRLGVCRGVITGYISTTQLTLALSRNLAAGFADYGCLSERLWAAGTWSLDAVVGTVSGLDHLEGLTVQILGDGNVLAEQVVTGGTVALSTPSSYVVAGLGYTAKLKTLPLSVSDQAIERREKRVNQLAVRVYNTQSLNFGDEKGDQLWPLQDRQGEELSTAPAFRVGMYELSITAEFTLDGKITVEKTGPVHATLLGYVSEVEIGN